MTKTTRKNWRIRYGRHSGQWMLYSPDGYVEAWGTRETLIAEHARLAPGAKVQVDSI